MCRPKRTMRPWAHPESVSAPNVGGQRHMSGGFHVSNYTAGSAVPHCCGKDRSITTQFSKRGGNHHESLNRL